MRHPQVLARSPLAELAQAFAIRQAVNIRPAARNINANDAIILR
jgi:hypothetical protein